MANFICQLDWATGCRNLSVQLLSCGWFFVTPWTAACQASLSITNSQSLLKRMSIEAVMPSNHLILCCPFSCCLQSFPASGSFPMSQFFAYGGQSIGASASVLPMNRQDWFPLGLTGLISLSNNTLDVSMRVFWIRLTFKWVVSEQISLSNVDGLYLISWRAKQTKKNASPMNKRIPPSRLPSN